MAFYVRMYPTAADSDRNMPIATLTREMKALTDAWPSRPSIKMARVGDGYARQWRNASFRGLGGEEND